MRKWCLIIMMIQLLSLFCSACSNDIMIDTVPQNFDISSGNNILHGGYVAKQGDSLLYSVIDDGIFNRSGLYVSHNNKEKRIIKGNISSINIQGDDIYYNKQEKIKKESIMEFNLYKYSISNREEYQIIKNCDTAIPAGDKIYYTVRFDDIGYKKENKQTPTGYEEKVL